MSFRYNDPVKVQLGYDANGRVQHLRGRFRGETTVGALTGAERQVSGLATLDDDVRVAVVMVGSLAMAYTMAQILFDVSQYVDDHH